MTHDPAVITCAISGAIANREQCPAIPYTPEEYAAEARRIVDEGGVHIHIHARTPQGTPSYEVQDFVAIRDAIVAEVGDAVIINFSTGTVGVPVEKRIAYLEAGRPEVAALTLGGSIRVGLEDNFYLPDGEMARSNGELIAQARRMTEEIGRRPTSSVIWRALAISSPLERAILPSGR